MKKVFGCCVALLFVGLSVGLAQKPSQRQSFVLNLDYAKFRNNDSTAYLEVYYGFYPSLVTYAHQGGQRFGILKVTTRIKDTLSGSYFVNRLSTVPIVEDTSHGLRSVLVSQAGYALPFGDYRLEVSVVDSLSPTRSDSILLPLSLKGHGSSVSVSDVELCSNIKSSTQKEDLYYKNSLEVVPNPTLVFGVASHPMMFHYAEIYNLDPSQSYMVRTQVLSGDGKVVKESAKTRKFGVKHAVEAGTTNVASIQSGKYHFRLIVADEKGNAVAQTEKTFFIYNPHVQASMPAATSIKASELAGLSADEMAGEFRKAQYIATDQEIKTFSQITSQEGRREFLAKFWSEVEAGRLGRPGMLRTVYLQRVLAADQRFKALGREGWRTDRGRVLILYSEPDEIERFPSSQNNKPYEIWYYYGIENGVQFVFVDRSGFGEYVLVNSTKRGELQDSDWQRFLQ